MNYYNEFDPHAAAWLRQLIIEGLIPPGEVDERSITEIQPHELTKYTQCHFFAGIGGWSLALQLADWPANKPVWTGSCPCQPFSVAGKGKGVDDERHLWPAFFSLIRKCRPDTVFGEQVESAIKHGWLDDIRADLEGEGYACGDCTLGAHSAGADHQRQRLYWVADSISQRLQRYTRNGDYRDQPRWDKTDQTRSTTTSCLFGTPTGFWDNSRGINCRDGKYRRIPAEPALFPLVDGVSYKLARRGSIRPALLKGAGNAIVPQVAAMFIRAFLEVQKALEDTESTSAPHYLITFHD